METQDALRRWVEHLRVASAELDAVRNEEIRSADNVQVLAMLEPAFNHAVRTFPMREESGMVEMQRVFAKLKR